MLQNVGIIINSQKDQAHIFSLYLIAHLTKFKISTWLENESYDHDGTDLIIVLGGDGTVLRAFQKFGHLEAPFLCINFGKLGFLSAVEPEVISQYLSEIIEGSFGIEERSVMQVSLGNDQEKGSNYVLNDLVIRSTQLKISRQLLRIDGRDICCYEGDGLIISTATGSTGYALSADGPIIEPVLRSILIKPLCSRSKALDSLIISTDHNLEIQCNDSESCCKVYIDGRESSLFQKGDTIYVSKANLKAKFAVLDPGRYFNFLRQRC